MSKDLDDYNRRRDMSATPEPVAVNRSGGKNAKAKAINEHVFVGDQLMIEYRLANNDRELEGQTEYGFSFILDDFDFGAPGKIKREKLAQTQQRG